MKSTHLTTLLVGLDLVDGGTDPRDRTTETLCDWHDLNPRTLLRYIEELRRLGMVIESRKGEDRRNYWVCLNPAQIRESGKLAKWIQLEQKRNLT